ncbi:hypothetical protein [Gordonia malaquae]|uniref:hypothetical protein n=1 Tax=Gordonia malaquae TaxID=410332 RepID=UPI0030179611
MIIVDNVAEADRTLTDRLEDPDSKYEPALLLIPSPVPDEDQVAVGRIIKIGGSVGVHVVVFSKVDDDPDGGRERALNTARIRLQENPANTSSIIDSFRD